MVQHQCAKVLSFLRYVIFLLLRGLYRVRQKYLTIFQNSCEWNCWRGEYVLERSPSEAQSISVAMERWSVAFAVETYLKKTTILSRLRGYFVGASIFI
jgi:hypothetical protein